MDKGTLRESFIMNQLINAKHRVTLPPEGDFQINETYTLEVGGKNKTAAQLKGVKNGFIAADDIEMGIHHKIPLWLFGFLYWLSFRI